MLDIQIFEVEGFQGGESVEDALEQGPVLVAMNPMLIYTWLYFFEFKPRERVEGEPEPVLPFYHQVTNEEPFRCAGQVQNSDHIIDFGSTEWTDRPWRSE